MNNDAHPVSERTSPVFSVPFLCHILKHSSDKTTQTHSRSFKSISGKNTKEREKKYSLQFLPIFLLTWFSGISCRGRMQDRGVFFRLGKFYQQDGGFVYSHIRWISEAKRVPARQIVPTRRRDWLLLYALNFRFEGRSIPCRFGARMNYHCQAFPESRSVWIRSRSNTRQKMRGFPFLRHGKLYRQDGGVMYSLIHWISDF